MPRRKRPHRHEIAHLAVDASHPPTRLCAIYTRLSDDDVESLSHAHQQAVAEAHAAKLGYCVAAIYRDWRTGSDPNRLALSQLIRDAIAGKHTAVIFYDHTRLHRAISGALPVLRLHREVTAYRFEAAIGEYDVDQAPIWADLSSLEVETTRRRSIEQRRTRAADGQLMSGHKPYWIERDQKTRLPVVATERACAVLEAILQYAGGVPMSRVAQWMTKHAIVTDGRAKWTSGRVRQLFRNPALWGDLAYGRSLVVTRQRGGEIVVVGRKRNPNAIPLRVPPLIHQTEAERAECQITGGCERDGYPAGDRLNALICANNARASGRAYELKHPLRRRVVCPWPKVRELFVDTIRNPNRLIAEVQAQVLAEEAAEWRRAADEITEFERLSLDLADLDARENRLCDRWDAGDISQNVYQTQVARVACRRRELENQRSDLLSQRPAIGSAERATESFQQRLAAAAKLPFDELLLESWSQLLDTLVTDVVVNEQGEPSLHWKLSL
jgi:DNA invertase Pin-like site-specific DNA recombinase